MLIVVQFTASRLLACRACACKAVINRTTAKFQLCAWFEFDWPPRNSWRVRFEIYWPLRKFGASAFCKLLSERCWNSYCSGVSLVFRHFVELFRKSTAERERCCSTSDIFSERVVSTWTLWLIVGHLLEPSCIVVDAGVQRGPSARRSPGVSWSVKGSGRVVPSHLIGSYRLIRSGRTVSPGLGCWTRTRRQNSSSLVVEVYCVEWGVKLYSLTHVEVRGCRSTSEDR